MTAREAAVRSLVRIEREKRYSNIETDVALRRGEWKEVEARLYTRLVYGTVERELTLDYLLRALVSMDFEKLDLEVRAVLRLSAYQILFMDGIPFSAAVNEGVNLCKKFKKSAAPMVNAVLRRLCREKENIEYPSKEREPVEYLSVFYSISRDVCAPIYKRLGFEECCRLFEKMNTPPPMTLRVNTLRISRDDFCARLESRGEPCARTAFSKNGVTVSKAASELEELKEGLCFVQDEASQLCVDALDARPGMTVMDCCACPGGKSFGAAMCMDNSGEVLSFDLHGNKLSLIERGAERLGISVIRTQEADGRIFREELAERADRVLCDLPCSGLGVIAKKPDLRYKKEEEMAKLPEIQWAILDNVCRYVKKGGKLRLPQNLSGDNPFVTLYPHIHGTDGFFISVLQKKP